MSTFVMGAADPTVLLHHMAFYGLADILDAAGAADVRLTWRDDRPTLLGDSLDGDTVEQAIRSHIDGRQPWTQRTSGPERRATMSPRLTTFKSDDDWERHRAEREDVLDRLTAARAWSDLRYLAALGEPSYWSVNHRGQLLQDNGASRFEMQPRNRGSEFVGNRLRPLADKLRQRRPGQITAGLAGQVSIDELGGKPDSVSATGLTTPGPVDNALVWCALWAIGQFPLAYRVQGRALTSGSVSLGRQEWFHVPFWRGTWRTARLRSILASEQLRLAATSGVDQSSQDAAAQKAAASWLNSRGVVGVLRFPVHRFGSDNAPERRALHAEAIPL